MADMVNESASDEDGRTLEPLQPKPDVVDVNASSVDDCGGATPPADKQKTTIDDDSCKTNDRTEDHHQPSNGENSKTLSDAENTHTETNVGPKTVVAHDSIATVVPEKSGSPTQNPRRITTNERNSNNDAVGTKDQTLDVGENVEKSGAAAAVNVPAKTGAKNNVARDNIASVVSKVSSLPSSSNPTTQINNATSNNDDDAIIRSASPPRLNEISPSNSPRNSQQRSIPQSRRSPAEGEGDEFGPFVDPVVESEWNPFGAEGSEILASGEMFSVDDDCKEEPDDVKSNNSPYHQQKSSGSSSVQTPEAELDSLRRVFDSEYERAIEDQEISWRARYGATRCSFIMSALLMVVYLWLGCMFYRSEAGWSVPDALLFTVYTVTTVGYGGPQPLPNTAAFHAFTSVYVIVGISLVTVLGAHTYQLVTLEATRMRSSSPWGKQRQGSQSDASNDFGQEALTREIDRYRQSFMNELEDLAREQPLLDATLVKIKEIQNWRRTTKWGRVLSVMLPFLGNIFLGAVVVGTIEEWSPLESIYWSIVTLTTVGYGDYVPTKNSSVWFCTLFFIPSSLFFLSFLLASVAKTYIRHHAIQVTRMERNMRRKNEVRRKQAERAQTAKRVLAGSSPGGAKPGEQSTQPASPGGTTRTEDVERGFTTVISYMEDGELDNSPTKRSGLFGDEAGNLDEMHISNGTLSPESSPALRYRANVIRNKDAAPDPQSNRAVSFAEALRSLNQPSSSPTIGGSSDQVDEFTNENRDTNKPSLDVRLRVQARLARIIAEEVAGYQTGVIIKGSTVSLTVGSLRDTAEKWKIPPQAWKAFRAVSFRSLLFVGERDLISDGGDALLRLNVVEFHQIFSPMLAAMGDGSSMEAWLAATDVLADVELRGGARYGRGKPIFNGTFT